MIRAFTYGHVENDDGRDESNPKATYHSASTHQTKASRSSLQDATNDEDPAARNNGRSTTNKVGAVTGDDGAKKGAER